MVEFISRNLSMAPQRALMLMWCASVMLLLSHTHAAEQETVQAEEAKSIFEVLVEQAALVTPTEFNQTDSDGEHGMESMGNTPHTGLRDDFVKVRRSPGRHARRFWGLLDGGLYG